MDNTYWLETNIYARINKNKTTTIVRLIVLIAIIIMFSFMQVKQVVEGTQSISGLIDIPSVRIGMVLVFVLLIILVVISLRMKKSVYQKKIMKDLEAGGTIEDLDQDMRNAKAFEKVTFSTFVGTRHVLTVYWTGLNAGRIHVMKYDNAASVEVVDNRYTINEVKEIRIQIKNSNNEVIGVVSAYDKNQAVEIVTEIEKNILEETRGEDREENLAIYPSAKEQASEKFNKNDKRIGLTFLILGAVILVLSLVYYIKACAGIPTDFEYKGSVVAKAYQVEKAGSTFYIHYNDTTSPGSFRESVSQERYSAAGISGDTIVREKYYSKDRNEYLFMKDTDLSAKQVVNKQRWEEAKSVLFLWFLAVILMCTGGLVFKGTVKLTKKTNSQKKHPKFTYPT